MLDDPLLRHLAELERSAEGLRNLTPGERAQLVRQLRRDVALTAADWVRASVTQKQWHNVPEATAEEWASGPLAVARFLAALEHHYRCQEHGASPVTPSTGTAVDGHTVHRLAGIPGLCDPLLLRGYRFELHVGAQPQPAAQMIARERSGGTALVLGAGNITATPILDTLDQVLVHARPVVLKLHPVQAGLHDTFARALAPLIERHWLHIVVGDAALGSSLAHAPSIRAVHLTGSDRTWANLSADERLAGKTLTGEVGCATPALIVPGIYRDAELRHVARQLAAYCAGNGGATCVAPRIVLTARSWPQRERILQLLADELAARPARVPFLPYVRQHFEQATGRKSPERLPATLIRDGDPQNDAAQCGHECFAPVLREIAFAANELPSLLADMTSFARQHCFGSLSAYVFAAPRILSASRPDIERAITDLPHGTIAVNSWTGLGYGLGTTPWGVPAGCPEAHGRGWVRDTSGLAKVRRVVITAPLRPRPLPPWLPQHRGAIAALRAFTRHTLQPSARRLVATGIHGLRSW